MAGSKDVSELFDTLGKILLRCFVLDYLFLLLWFLTHVFAGDVMHGIGGRLFGLSSHEMDIVDYCGISAVKCIVWLFFLLPYLAIRLVLRKRT